MRRSEPALFFLAATVFGADCTGHIGGTSGSSSFDPATEQGGTTATPPEDRLGGVGSAPPAGAPALPNMRPASGDSRGPLLHPVGPSPLRRLTRAQYNNAVQALFGGSTHPADGFSSDAVNSFGFPALSPISSLDAERYLTAAEEVARAAVVRMSEWLRCNPSLEGESVCATQLLETIGRRIFRRPLETQETMRFRKLYDGSRAQGQDFGEGVRIVLEALLQSPYFLYRAELDAPTETGVVPLSAFETATRLSFFLWDSIPDDKLLDEATAGRLLTADEIEAQARRMLRAPAARQTMAAFHHYWLDLARLDHASKDPALFPAFDDGLRAAMRRETDAFVGDVLLAGDGRLETLLTASYSFVNPALASLYGVALPPDTSEPWARVALDPSQRAGILTQASLLAAHAGAGDSARSPILRGKMIRERLLCQMVPPPPPDVPDVKPLVPGQSVRDQLAEHRANPACRTCHALMEPIGFGLESYDAIGRFRPGVDASGTLTGSGDLDGDFRGAVELSQRLARSVELRSCAMKQWFRFALGRDAGTEDAHSIEAAYAAFAKSDFNVREMIVALVRTPAFVRRHVAR